jgi:flavodoxin
MVIGVGPSGTCVKFGMRLLFRIGGNMAGVLIVYDSYFGNTEKVAQAICSTLGTDVLALRVGEVRPEHLQGLKLLIVGSPTRAFQPSDGTKRFLKSLPVGALSGVRVAAFDTRLPVEEAKSGLLKFLVGIFGYAAKPIGEKLKKSGGTLVVPPEGFYVKDSEGPLKDGELERAAVWAKTIL